MLDTIFLNFSLTQVEVTSLVLDIASSLCWLSDKALDMVLNSLANLMKAKKNNYAFEPFIKILEDSKNVIMLFKVMSFLNTIVEAPSEEEKRVELKEDLLVHGISISIGEIRLRLMYKEFQLSDCSYEAVMRQSLAQNTSEMYGVDLAAYSDENTYLSEDQTEEFESVSQQLTFQMEAFDELLKELEESSDDNSSVSSETSQSQESSSVKPSPRVDKSKNTLPKRNSVLQNTQFSVRHRMSVSNFTQMQQQTIPEIFLADLQQMIKVFKNEDTPASDLESKCRQFLSKLRDQPVSLFSKFIQTTYTRIIQLINQAPQTKKEDQYVSIHDLIEHN